MIVITWISFYSQLISIIITALIVLIHMHKSLIVGCAYG